MGVHVRRPAPAGGGPASGPVDRWDALPGDTRWVDYSHQVAADGFLTVYVHTFRRFRDRSGAEFDLLGWKPGTTKIASEYAPAEWLEVEAITREWPPAAFERVERVVGLDGGERRPRRERRAR